MQIRVKPDVIRDMSKNYLGASQQINDLLQILKTTQSSLAYEWEGAAYNAFNEQFNMLAPKVQDFSNLLEDIYRQLHGIANVIEETDMMMAERIGFFK